MDFIRASKVNVNEIYELVQNTINTIYPKYYPLEVVKFFSELHTKDKINSDIEKNYVYILLIDGLIVGTGSFVENHITRVFVNEKYQGKGYGSFIMKSLEEKIASHYDTSLLDASLAASRLYEHRGYKTVSHEQFEVSNGAILVYEIMEKRLHIIE